MISIATRMGLSAAIALSATALSAQDYPADSMTAIVGYAPGGGTDIMVRSVAPLLARHLGDKVSIAVENRAGAGGQIGWSTLAASPADGSVVGNMNLPSMVSKVYDREVDFDIDSFTWIGTVMQDPNVLVVAANSEFKSLDDVIAAAKADPGGLSYGIGGLGGEDHFVGVLLEEEAGIDLNIIPFGGGADSRTSIMGGHVDLGGLNYSEVADFGDDLRVLAVFSDKRIAALPEVPTATEAGYDILMSSIRGIVAPAGLPDDVRDQLVAGFEDMAQDPDFLALEKTQGFPIMVVTGADYKALAEQQSQTAKEIWESTPWR